MMRAHVACGSDTDWMSASRDLESRLWWYWNKEKGPWNAGVMESLWVNACRVALKKFLGSLEGRRGVWNFQAFILYVCSDTAKQYIMINNKLLLPVTVMSPISILGVRYPLSYSPHSLKAQTTHLSMLLRAQSLSATVAPSWGSLWKSKRNFPSPFS